MFFIKNSFFFFLFLSFFFSNDWVLKYKGHPFYEKDFYSFFPQSEWNKTTNNGKRTSVLTEFTKEVACVYEATVLGLDLGIDINERLVGRFDRLLVNEYYMREFLGSVIPDKALSFCKQNLKKTVFVNHILIDKKDKNFAVSLLDSLVFGKSFDSLAFSFSKDPSAKQNKGSLGWVTIGQTVPSFQNKVFRLCEGCVGLLETDFGFHVVRVDSIKKSFYADLSKDEYNDFAFRFATGYIKTPLKSLAEKHDSSLLVDFGVVFDYSALSGFIDQVSQKVLESKNKRREDVDFVGLLGEVGPVVVYGESVLSGRWFAHKFSGPFYKNVFFDSLDGLIKELRLILLRDIVSGLALKKGVDKSFSFEKQFSSIKKEILKKEFLRFLVASVSPPSKKDVELYYNENEEKKFTNKATGKPFGLSSAYGSVEAILLKEKQDAAKSSFFNSLQEPYVVINKRWLDVD